MNIEKGEGSVSETALDGRTLLPCTPTQERSWILTQFRPEDASFSIAVLWEIKGAFHSAAFEEAFRTVIQRHEILRTRFVEVDGEPMQEVMEKAAFSLSVIDFSILPAAARRDRAMEICDRESKLPFDLAVPPLLRATAIRLDDSSALLLIVAHPSVFDGSSIGVLGRELGETVSALHAKRTFALPALALQYGDYALWHREYISRGGLDEDRQYWQQTLHDLPYFELTPDFPRPRERSQVSGSLSSPLDAELGNRLEMAAKKSGITFFAFGCAIIAAMLRECTGKSDIVIGTQVAGRNDVDLEPLIGAFVNNLVLRFKASADRSFCDFATEVAGTVRDALVHQHMPFDQLVRLLNPKRDMSRMPLYSINVILQPAFMEDATYGDFSLVSAPSPTVATLTDLNFLMIKRPAGWRMTLEYNTDLFEKRTAERLFDLWTAAIEVAVCEPAAKLSDFGKAAADKAAQSGAHAGSSRAGNQAPALPAAGEVSAAAHGGGSQAAAAASAPTTEADSKAIEQKLIGIWRTILRVQDVTPTSNFFDLGGHSLSALRMLARASQVLGVKADPAAFFRMPTIAALSRYSADLEGADQGRIVPIQPLGSQPPAIAINGAVGYYNFYNSLSAKLGLDQPLFSVQTFDPAVPGASAGLLLEKIASDHLHLIRTADPVGPYVLLGHCAYGVIAFEVAQQLRREGKTILAIVMFDSWAPGHMQSLNPLHRFLMRLQSRYQVHKNRISRLLRREMTILECIASYRSIRAIYRPLMNIGFEGGMQKGITDEELYLADVAQARLSYRPQSYDGDVLLIASADCARGPLIDPDFGWRKFVKGRIAVRWVGGSHMTMGYGGGAAVIAEHIRAFLPARD
ncbi:MAG TPA: condensation domain-containing protein [Rhizomicrobium sp.]|nr:condensation domain-containing protein [Rhizomicrobium sp.]